MTKKFKEYSTQELEEIYYCDNADYSDTAQKIIKGLLDPRDDRRIDFTHNYCPLCKKLTFIEKPSCTCGFSFIEENMEKL